MSARQDEAASAVRSLLAAHRRALVAPIAKAIGCKILNPQPPKDISILCAGAPYPSETHPHVLVGLFMRPNVPDADGDLYSFRTIEEAAHWFMVNGRLTDSNHSWTSDPEIMIVESAILRWPLAPEAKVDLLSGDWFGGIACTEKRFAEYQAGIWHGFSFGGAMQRDPKCQAPGCDAFFPQTAPPPPAPQFIYCPAHRGAL